MKKYYFGRYIYKNSIVHRLNPLVKLLAIVVAIAVTAVPGSPFRVAGGVALLIGAMVVSKISFKEFYPSIRSFRFLLILTFFIQAFFTSDGGFTIRPTLDMVLFSFFSTTRFALIIGFSAIFTITTTPADIARALYFFVRPLKRFKVNTQDVAISLLVAIRFIPLLFEESDKIITAQKLRGAWPTNKSFKDKLKFFIRAESLVVPLFMRVVHYAEQISITLCYRRDLEKVMVLPKVITSDYIFLAITFIFAGCVYAL